MDLRLIAVPLLLACSTVQAEPASTRAALWLVLDECARSATVPRGAGGSELTVMFSVKRDGSLHGQPRITYSHLTGNAAAQEAFVRASLASIQRCFPLPITNTLGGAVAGQPLRLRITTAATDPRPRSAPPRSAHGACERPI